MCFTNAGDIGLVIFEGTEGVGVVGVDIEDFDVGVAASSQDLFVWAHGEAVDLL